MKNKSKIEYTKKHKKAFLQIEKELCGKNSVRGYLHDCDKLILFVFLDSKKVSKWHRKHSKHHGKARTKKDYIQMVIDWECARFTKPDKPLNARETLEKYYPELKKEIEPILIELQLYGCSL